MDIKEKKTRLLREARNWVTAATSGVDAGLFPMNISEQGSSLAPPLPHSYL